MRKVDLDTAAEYFGISSDAVRKRIERGSLDGIKESGRWKVFIMDDRPDETGQIPDETDKVVEALEKHIESLERDKERQHQTIEAQQRTIDLLQRNQEQTNFLLALKEQKILELEAPKKKESWFRRFFFGESKDSNSSI